MPITDDCSTVVLSGLAAISESFIDLLHRNSMSLREQVTKRLDSARRERTGHNNSLNNELNCPLRFLCFLRTPTQRDTKKRQASNSRFCKVKQEMLDVYNLGCLNRAAFFRLCKQAFSPRNSRCNFLGRARGGEET